MTEDELNSRLYAYYDKIKQPKYTIKNWIISDDNLYLKHKNKLTFSNICFINKYSKDCVVVAESKKEYYAIKYSGRFVCVRRSETEYGLVGGDYEILVVNKVLREDEDSDIIPFKDLCKILDWKLGKKAREYLDYFR